MARRTGIRPTTINELYNEIAERVNLSHLDLICEALNCDITDILVRVPNDLSDGTVVTSSGNNTDTNTKVS